MAQADVTEFIALGQNAASLRIADLLSKGIFGALLGLIVLTAIPYGTVEPWWKAVFACLVFALCIGAILEGLLTGGLSNSSKQSHLVALAIILATYLHLFGTQSARILFRRVFLCCNFLR